MNNYIDRQRQLRKMPLHRGPKPPSDPIPLHCPTQHLADSKSDPWSGAVLPAPKKNCDVGRKILLPFLVYRLEVGVPKQS